MSMAYIRPIILGVVFFSLNYSFNAVLVSTGDTRSYRNVLMAGALLNAVLDPWFLFGGLGLPALGIAGVGWATTLIQGLASLYLGRQALRTGLIGFDRLSEYRPRIKAFLDIARQGVPASLNMMTVAVGIFIITYFLSMFGQDAVAAYGTATRIEQIFLMPFAGLNTATLTLVAQNNGAGRIDRVREVVRTTLAFGVGVMAAAGVVLFFLCRILMSLFNRKPGGYRSGPRLPPGGRVRSSLLRDSLHQRLRPPRAQKTHVRPVDGPFEADRGPGGGLLSAGLCPGLGRVGGLVGRFRGDLVGRLGDPAVRQAGDKQAGSDRSRKTAAQVSRSSPVRPDPESKRGGCPPLCYLAGL